METPKSQDEVPKLFVAQKLEHDIPYKYTDKEEKIQKLLLQNCSKRKNVNIERQM